MILGFVHGRQPLDAVQTFGVKFTFTEEGMLRAQGKETGQAQASLKDIAQGLLRLKDDPEHLRQWSAVLLSATIVELPDIKEDDDVGNLFLDTLWDAAFGEPISKKAIVAAKELAGES